MKSHPLRAGFTLMEMLVVSGIIIALSSMVLGLSYRSIRNAMQRSKTVEILSILRTGINQAAADGRSIITVEHPLVGANPTLVIPPWAPSMPDPGSTFSDNEFPIYGMERSKCRVLANRGDYRYTPCPPTETDNQKVFEYLFAGTGQLDELRALGAIYQLSKPPPYLNPIDGQLLPGAGYVPGKYTGKAAYRINGMYFYDSYGSEILAFPSTLGGGKELVLMSTGGFTKLPSGGTDQQPRFGNPNGTPDDKARYNDNIFDGRP